MHSVFRVLSEPRPCVYLPDRTARTEYEMATLDGEEYLRLMREGWRRFGHLLFRPSCPACTACRSLRVRVADFRPTRSQKRNRALNEGEVELVIGEPSITEEKLELYDRFHAMRAETKGWPEHGPKDARSYAESYVLQPFPVEEWCYYREGRLIGVGYADHLAEGPEAGMSAIYFFWEPDEARRGLGTWNVLKLIEETARRGLPYLYLGYYVEGSPAMAYKPLFVPNELRGDDGIWRLFRE